MCYSSVGRDVVARTAKLAQLELTDDEVDRLTPEFQKIIGFVDRINELDVDGVDPMASAQRLRNVLRKDDPTPFAKVYSNVTQESCVVPMHPAT